MVGLHTRGPSVLLYTYLPQGEFEKEINKINRFNLKFCA